MAKYGQIWQSTSMSSVFTSASGSRFPSLVAENTWQWHKLCTVARIKCVAAWLPHHNPARLGSCRMWHSNNAKPSHHCFMQSNDPLSWLCSLLPVLCFRGTEKRAAGKKHLLRPEIVRNYCLFPTTNGQTPCLTALEFDADTSLLESCAIAAA